jgi:flagellar biogenesis protein FliO
MGPTASYLVETFVTLLVVCALAFVVLYGARRLGIGRARGPIALVGQLPLDARRAIYLVRVGEAPRAQVIVVGVGEGGFTKLGEIPGADLPEGEATRAGAPFADVLARVLGGRASAEHATAKDEPEADGDGDGHDGHDGEGHGREGAS